MRVDQRLRYRLIEIIALWEGRLTTNHLCQAFDIGRQQASKDINTYIRESSGASLEYDRSLKGYKPAKGFMPRFCKGHVDEYLQLLDRHDDLGDMLSLTSLQPDATHYMDAPSRYVSPQVVRTLIQAARQGLTVEGHYESLSAAPPQDDPGRLLAPHTLVYNGFRWHVRAWCEKNQQFRDFVISRFRGELSLEQRPSGRRKEEDTIWNRQIDVELIPNPRLEERQRRIIARDYGMDPDTLSRSEQVSEALLPYYLKRWDVSEPYNNTMPAEHQHLVLGSISESS
ncbi:WYL domain-containing protein [Ferrimonas sp.]|uniref:WYL domain-containing protein n=1 Tax=Ferrimonas sp. TaxID=2080861 RepID=UPI003A8E1222